MDFEIVALGDSPVHRLDPRARLVAAAAFSVVVAVLNGAPGLGMALAAAVALAAAARLSPRLLVRRLVPALSFVAMLWVVLPLTHPGRTVVLAGPVAVSPDGVALAGRITLKALAILLAMVALAATMPLAVMGHALERLHAPPKLIHLLLLCYRYISVLQQEYGRLRRAARVRGFQPATDLHTYRTYAYLLGMLFVRAAARAERVCQAMRCRGFQGRFHSLAVFTLRPRDLLFLAAVGLLLAGLIATEWVWLRRGG